MPPVAMDPRFFLENGLPTRHQSSFDRSKHKKTLGNTTAARLLHIVAKCFHAAFNTHPAVLSNPANGMYAPPGLHRRGHSSCQRLVLTCVTRFLLNIGMIKKYANFKNMVKI